MVKKQKFLKNLLTSVSVASVVASIGGSSVALGDFDIDPTNAGNMNVILTGVLANAGGSAIFNANNLILTIDGASPAEIEGIIVTNVGASTVIGNNITIGTIAANGNVMTATINAGNTLTLGGNGHTGLGITTLEGIGSTLKLKGGATINNAITTLIDTKGALIFEGAGEVTGNIGEIGKALASVDFTGAGNVKLKGALNNALIFNINHADANVTADNDLTGSVTFGANGGTLKTPNVTGDVTFGDGGGTLNGNVNGDATFGAGAGMVGNVNGNVIFGAGAGMAGNVGGSVTVGAGNASVGAVTGNVTFANAGQLTVGGRIGGDVDFAGKAGTIILTGGQTIGGNVDNTGAANGVLLFLGAGEVTGRIGENNALKTVQFNGPGEVHLRHVGNAAKATTFSFNNTANVTAHGGIEGNVVFMADGKLNLENDKTIDGIITTDVDGAGTLTFLGNGTANGAIGADIKALKEVNIRGTVTLKDHVFAKETKLIDGSVIKLEDGKNITGAITTAADGKGTLIFEGGGKVTGNIGIAGVALAGIDIGVANGAGGKVIKLERNVFTKELNFVTANEVEITGNFGEVGAVGKVDFNAGGTLTFNGPVADPKIFNSTIDGGANGTLNVRGNLKAINADIGEINIINIGTAANGGNVGVLTIDASDANVALLTNGVDQINFLHAHSVLTLYNDGVADRTITFANNLTGGVGPAGALTAPGGVVLMHGDGGNTLTLKSVGGKTLGANAANSLQELEIRGKVTIAGDVDALDIQHIPVLNIINGAEFTDESATSAQIANVNIGSAANGSANYIIDTKHGPVNILPNAADQIHFLHEQSQLTLRNSNANADRTITLLNNLDPGGNNMGVVEFNSGANNKILKIDGAAKTLGIVGRKLKGVNFSGNGNIEVVPAIYAKTITLNTTGNAEITTNGVNGDVVFAKAGTLKGNVTGGVIFKADGRVTGNITGLVTVNAGDSTVDGVLTNVAFTGDGQLTTTQDIGGNVDFANRAGTIKLANTRKIVGAIRNSSNATLEFLGEGELTATNLNLKTLKAGAGDVNLATGNYNIKEIQGNGVHGSLTFANDFNLKGGINLTAGNAVNLIFAGNGSIDSDVGTNANPVGSIQIKAGTVTFGGAINSNNDLVIANKAMADIAKDLKAHEIKGKGTVKFSNKDKIVIDSPIDNDTILEIAGADVEAVKKVSAQNIIFSSAKSATLTLKTASTINGITTTGNNFYSLALGADCSTGTNDIAANVDIKLLGDHTITINSKNFYSDILTEKNNSGKVIFKAENSVAYGNLGADKFRLADVIFDNNSTVRADIYSKKITISADKTATFAGVEKRTIAVPTINIKGVELPRLSKEFSYYTLIDSDNIDAKPSSEIKFENAALVKAPIKDGQVTLADNVWFKGKVDSTSSVSFANKYVLLEKDIKFASIEASQAKIISLPGNQTIAGDLTAKDLTIDLGTNKLKYVGNAILTGTLQLDTFYDSLKKAGGNIEIQGKLDISQLDRLDVNITARSDSSKISKDTQYTLISLANKDDNTVIDKDKVKLVSVKEQNSFVEWSLDPTTLTLHAKNITKEELKEKLKEKEGKKDDDEGKKDDEGKEKKETKGKIEEVKKEAKKFVIDSPNNSAQEIAFIKQLLQVEFNGDSDAAKFLSQYGSMDSKNQDLATNRLLPGNENLIGQSPMNSTAAVMTLMSQVAVAATQVAGRTATVGAGDDDKVMYGVWGSPFYSTANQKMQQGVSGYNMKSAGLIVGFDGLVNDNLLVGAAYSLINTKMSHKNQKSGDRTNGQTNIFSLYGVYKFADNWFAESIASYGITNVKNLEGRLISAESASVTAIEKAVAKYKSTSYGGQLVTGYNYQASEQLTITPAIGFRYSQFMDDGHTETGTTCQNLVVKKRSYNKFEGIFGLRTEANIQLDQLLLIPEVHGYVNYDFKGKSPVIDARLGGIDKALPTKLVKPDRVFFNVGTGLTAKHNMMEYGVTYNAHIASKYIGHQGSLKIKVNF